MNTSVRGKTQLRPGMSRHEFLEALSPGLGDLCRESLSGLAALMRPLNKRFSFRLVTGFHKRFYFMFGPDVISWPHFLYFESFGDDAKGVAFLAQRH